MRRKGCGSNFQAEACRLNKIWKEDVRKRMLLKQKQKKKKSTRTRRILKWVHS